MELYKINNLLINIPFKLVEQDIEYPEEYINVILESKTLAFNSNTFNIYIPTVLYNDIEPNLLGAYQQGMEDMTNTKGYNNFQSQKKKYY